MPRLLRILVVAFSLCASLSYAADPSPRHFLIRGNIVTPDSVIANGWLDIQDGRIARILTARPDDTAGVTAVETSDFIFPGFIDLHNHPSFNVFPRWTPPLCMAQLERLQARPGRSLHQTLRRRLQLLRHRRICRDQGAARRNDFDDRLLRSRRGKTAAQLHQGTCA
jgi:hypothetical protein